MRNALLLVFAAGFLTACGTIIHGTTQQVGISSDPGGATVEVDGHTYGETPVTAELSRNETHSVRLNLDGYEPYEMIINRKVSGWVAGNIVFGGLVGLAVDAATGGLYRLDPKEVRAKPRAQGAGHNADEHDDVLQIAIVLEPDPEWEQIGTLTPVEK